MSVTSQVSSDGKSVRITVLGRFDFTVHDDFQGAYDSSSNVETYLIDLAGVDYMDSSALGMLLLLKEHASENVAHIQITNCAPEVRNILRISNFDKMFEVS